MRKIKFKHPKTQRQSWIVLIVFVVLFIWSLLNTPLNFDYFKMGIQKVPRMIQGFLNPDWTTLPQFLNDLGDTLSIAYVGLMTSLLVAFPLSFLAASNTTPFPILSKILRALISLIRAVPLSIWGLIGAASIGFGSQAGVLGLFLPTSSYLIRVLADRIEEGGNEVIEALKTVGAPWIVIMVKGVFISLLPQFISNIAMRFEMTVSETIGLGMVGIAGIGYTLSMSIGLYRFEIAIVAILLIFLTMFLLEYLTKFINKLLRRDNS